MRYLPPCPSEDMPFCRWSTRDGCRCTVDAAKPTEAVSDDAATVLRATVEALETICYGVPYLTEHLDELVRRVAGDVLDRDSLRPLDPWLNERIGLLSDDALSTLYRARKVDDALHDLRAAVGELHTAGVGASCPTNEEFVYLIAADRFLKIGFSTDVLRRLSSLRTAVPMKLSVVAVVRGSRVLEQQLHRRFSEYRERGEWYRDAPDIRTFFTTHPSRVEV